MASNKSKAMEFLQITGAYLFPSIFKDGEHKPLIKWKLNSSNDYRQIEKWAEKWPDCYFCVNLKASKMSAIDIDDKNQKNGSLKFKNFLSENKLEFPETLTIKTPSGGYHHIYSGSHISGKLIKGAVDLPGMIPVPGSIVPGKGKYSIVNGRHELENIPEWLKALEKPKIEKKEYSGILDDPANINTAKRFLLVCSPAIEGQNGDITTFKTACKLKDLGLSEEKTCDLMIEIFNPRCLPPWNIRDIRLKVKNAFEYGELPIGVSAIGFEEIQNDSPLEKEKKSKTGFQLIRIGELLGKIEKIEWLIDGFFEKKSLNMIYGESGAYKSFLAVSIACSIASGTKWYGRDIEQGPVVYIAGEGLRGIPKRVQAWAEENSVNGADIDMYLSSSSANLLDPENVMQIKKSIAAVNPVLIIYDTLARNFGGGDENKTADMVKFINEVDSVGVESASLLIHHTGLMEKDRARGSSALRAALDSEFRMSFNSQADKESNKPLLILTNTKMKDSEKVENIYFEKQIRILDFGNIIESVVLKKIDQADIDDQLKNLIIENMMNGISDRKLSEKFNMNRRKIRKIREDAITKGFISEDIHKAK